MGMHENQPSVKTHEEYVDSLHENSRVVEELRGLLNELVREFLSAKGGVFALEDARTALLERVKSQGYDDDKLQGVRLYHLLIGSTPSPDVPMHSFDVEGGLIEHFIRTKGAEYRS